MTWYHGGKERCGKKIAEEISKFVSGKNIVGYCEPFCGMLGVYKHIDLGDINYLAGDSNHSLILMWKKLIDGWDIPEKITSRNEFDKLRANGKSSHIKGFVGHLYGYMGKYFCPFNKTINIKQIQRLKNKISKIIPKISKVKFSYGTFEQYSDLKNYVIYCDPPYLKQAHYYDEYSKRKKFNYDEFYKWCIKMSENNIVIISEINLDSRFKKICDIGDRNKRMISVEKLYTPIDSDISSV